MPTVMEIGISAYMEVMVVESGKEMNWVLIPLHTCNGLCANTTTYKQLQFIQFFEQFLEGSCPSLVWSLGPEQFVRFFVCVYLER